MVPISRIGDLAPGMCYHGLIPHPIVCTLITGSAITTVDGLNMGRIGDLYATTDPFNPIAVSISGSVITTDSGLGVARVGDLVLHLFGTAALATGSPITTSD